MAFEHNEGSMSIFKNTYKEKENQPDYTGTAKVDGKMKRVACWVKEGKNGKFFSCQIQDPRPQQSTEPPAAANNDFDDDIPF